MPTDPRVTSQLRQMEDFRRRLMRDVDHLTSGKRALERREVDLRRLPGAARELGQLRDQIRSTQRTLDGTKGKLRDMERTIAEMKRIMR